MIIKKINIINYGRLSNFKAELSDGINIIEGKNESGKSTICDFIKFIFYGLPQNQEDREKAVSWGTNSCSGSLVVKDRDNLYRIEREATLSLNSDGKNVFRDRSFIFDENTGKQIHKNEIPGEIFFGIPRNVFESTSFIGQIDGSRSGGKELAKSSENILFSADENINTKKAVKKLDEARVLLYYKNKKGGKIYDLIKEKEELSERLSEAQKTSANIINYEGTLRNLKEAKEKAEARLDDVSEELSSYERYEIKKSYIKLTDEKRKSRESEKEIARLMENDRYVSTGMTDEQFYTLLSDEKGELLSLESDKRSALKSVESIKNRLSDMNAKLNNFQNFGKDETRDSLVEKAKNSKSKGELFKKLFVLFALLTAVAGIASIPVAVFLNISVALVLWCVAFVAMTAGLFCFIQSDKLKKTTFAIYRKFSCKSHKEFEELLSAAANDKMALFLLEDSEREAKENFKIAGDKVEEKKAHIRKIISDASFAVSDDIYSDIENAYSEAKKSEEYMLSVVARKQNADEKVKELAASLSRYGDDEIENAIKENFDEERMSSFDFSGKKKEKDFLSASIAAQTEKIHSTECELASLYAVQQKPSEIAQVIEADSARISELTEKFDAYMLAIESIEAAGNSLRDSVSPNIAKTASGIMENLSGGKYGRLFIDSDFGISYSDNGITRDISSLSSGTSDIAYISLRIALVDLLCKKTLPVFVFDESFTRLDDERLLLMLSFLKEAFSDNSQAIILSCQDREKNIASNFPKARFLSI